jgi:hypothetical protein
MKSVFQLGLAPFFEYAPIHLLRFCSSLVISQAQNNFSIQEAARKKPHKTKSTSCSIFLTLIIMNAKNTRFYAEGAMDFAEMCSTTYSYQREHDCIENYSNFGKFYFCAFSWFLLLVQIASLLVSTEKN